MPCSRVSGRTSRILLGSKSQIHMFARPTSVAVSIRCVRTTAASVFAALMPSYGRTQASSFRQPTMRTTGAP